LKELTSLNIIAKYFLVLLSLNNIINNVENDAKTSWQHRYQINT